MVTCNGELGEPCCPNACPMLGKSGCKTENLGCKIWLCNEAIKILKQSSTLFDRWVVLSGIVGKLQLKHTKYKSKEKIIENFDVRNLGKLYHQQSILNNILTEK